MRPLLGLLRLGHSPERLAWSLAVGVAVGINPVLGSTTAACLLVAYLLRLNLAASQISNHLVYPLQIALFLPFLRMGTRFFRTSAVPLEAGQLMHLARTHPIALSRQVWAWEGHALIVWMAVAVMVAPVIALLLTPVLRRLHGTASAGSCPLAS